MKKIIFTIIAISLSTLLQAQQSLTKNQQAVKQTVTKIFAALSNRDSVSLKNYSTADITLYEYGQVWNIDTLILKAITQNQAADFKRTNTFDFSIPQQVKLWHWLIIVSNQQLQKMVNR